MNGKKIFLLEPLYIGQREIYPIALLKIIIFNDIFFSIDYEISAFKIIENKKIYFKNINLSQKEFKSVSKTF